MTQSQRRARWMLPAAIGIALAYGCGEKAETPNDAPGGLSSPTSSQTQTPASTSPAAVPPSSVTSPASSPASPTAAPNSPPDPAPMQGAGGAPNGPDTMAPGTSPVTPLPPVPTETDAGAPDSDDSSTNTDDESDGDDESDSSDDESDQDDDAPQTTDEAADDAMSDEPTDDSAADDSAADDGDEEPVDDAADDSAVDDAPDMTDDMGPEEPPGDGNVILGQGGVVNATIVVNAGEIFDGQGLTFTAGSALGDGSQDEDQQPVFRLEDGAQLRNVILGSPAADGIHCYGDVTLNDITWLDIGEDALTIKESGTVILDGGSAQDGEDKVFQINAASTFIVRNFTARNAGKFIRQNGDTTFRVDVIIENCDISQMDECIFRTDSSSSTVSMSDTRYSDLGDGLFVGVNSANITLSNNTEY